MRMRLHLWDLKCPRMMWIIAEKGGAQENNWIENPDWMCTHHHLQQTISGLYSPECFLRMRNNILFLHGHLCAGYWWLYWPFTVSSELHQRAVNSFGSRSQTLNDNNLSALVTKTSRNIGRQALDQGRVWRQLPSQRSNSEIFLPPSKFQSVYFVYSVSLGILSQGLANLLILTFTVLGMAVRVKFYCALICQVSGNLRILFLRQIRNLLSSLSQGQVRPGVNAAVTRSFILFLPQSLGASF